MSRTYIDCPPRRGEEGGEERRYTNPVALTVKQPFGLQQHLLIGIILGDALGKVGRIGVDLQLSGEHNGQPWGLCD